LQLCLLMPDGRHLSVCNDTTLEIAGGLLQLPAIHMQPDWFTADTRGTATLVLLDDEPGLGLSPAAAGSSSNSSSSQQLEWEHPPQEELGRFSLRLAPAAERLLLMAAGPQFEGVRVELPPQHIAGRGKGQRSETLFILQEVRNSVSKALCNIWMLGTLCVHSSSQLVSYGRFVSWLCKIFSVAKTKGSSI
jgi:hypothetical protein